MFDDPHVLSFIIDAFLSVLSNQLLVGEFEKAVDSFKSSAEMGHLVDLLKKKKRSKRSRNCQIQCQIKGIQECWSRCRVKNFESAMKELLGSLYHHLSCMLVDRGCCCISWIIFADIPHASQLLPKHSMELFKIIGARLVKKWCTTQLEKYQGVRYYRGSNATSH